MSIARKSMPAALPHEPPHYSPADTDSLPQLSADPPFPPHFLCTTRCVRHAYLRGTDPYTGRNCDHRKDWMVSHLARLANTFCIECVELSLQPSSYQLVLRLDQALASSLSHAEIIQRWSRLYSTPPATVDYLRDINTDLSVQPSVTEWCERRRADLLELSRFLGHFNQTIARRANLEDGCRGRFWEARSGRLELRDPCAVDALICSLRPAPAQ